MAYPIYFLFLKFTKTIFVDLKWRITQQRKTSKVSDQ